MPTRAAALSKPDSLGHYHRQLGWKINASGNRVQHKFRFGCDRSEAEIREALLRRFWSAIEANTPARKRPVWSESTLAIASQIAKGAQRILIEPTDASESPTVYRRRLQIIQDNYPFLRFEPTDAERYKQSLSNDEIFSEGVALDGMSEALLRRRSEYENSNELHHRLAPTTDPVASIIAFGQQLAVQLPPPPVDEAADEATLHEAFDAYIEWIKEEYYQPDIDTLSDYGHTRLGHFKTLKERHDDCPLTEIDLDRVEAMYRYWRRRPISKAFANKGKPIARTTARHMLGALGQFFKWLNRSKKFA